MVTQIRKRNLPRMTLLFLQITLIFALLFVSCLAVAEEIVTRSYSLPNHGSIQLKVPKSWQSEVSQPPNNLPPTIKFVPQGAPSFKVLVTPIWAARPDIELPGPSEMRREVEKDAEKAKPQAVEKDLLIRKLIGPSVVGYYFTATDKAPKPGEYKYMTQGMFRLDELLVTFTVLTNDASKNVSGETTAILEDAAYSKKQSASSGSSSNPAQAGTLQISQREKEYVLTVPLSRLVMSIPKSALSQKTKSVGGSTDNPRYFYFEDPASHLVISGWFEPDQKFKGVKQVWEEDTGAWKKNGMPAPHNVSFKKIGKWDGIVYDMKLPEVTNSHIRAHWVQAGTWLDIHLSVTSSQSSKEVRSKLESLLKSITVTEKK